MPHTRTVPRWYPACVSWSRRALVAVLLLVGGSGGASAEPATPAEQAFTRGKDALTVGKYAEACAAFEDSQRLDPQPVTLFNIALCDEQLGKLASALAIYTQLVEHDDTPGRRAKSAEMLGELSVRVPRLEIRVADPPPGLEITVNGVPALDRKNLPVDLGTSRIVARAPGIPEWTGEVTAKAEGERLSITIPLGTARPPATPRDGAPRPVSTLSGREKLGLVLLVGGGVVALAGGGTFGLLARSAWHDAKDVCGGTVCTTQMDLDAGQVLVDRARTRGTIATALVVAGGLVAVGGAIVWITAPDAERKVALAPTGTASSFGLAVLGSF